MLLAFVLNILTIAYALPYGYSPKNLITMLPRLNCPGNKVWTNGACREIWLPEWKLLQISPKNVITVPPNCPPGQEYINGECRDVFDGGNVATLLQISPKNVITVSPNCPPGQEYINGECRDIFRGGNVANSLLFNQQLENLWNDDVRKVQQTRVQVVENSNVNNSPRHIISVPKQCPIGYRPDALGICRPIL